MQLNTPLKELKLATEIVFASDIDKFAKQSYFANYKIDEDNWYDMMFKTLKEKNIKEKSTYLVGGSPCQSFSMVGKKKRV